MKGLRFKHQLRISLSNFLERKWRNVLIAVATSIGFTGIFIAFGLGNAIVDLINEGTSGGQLPAQVQISLNSDVTGTSIISDKEIKELEKLAGGRDKLKYLEVPFSFSVASYELDGKSLDFTEKQPQYAQVSSLYEDVTISAPVNTVEEVLAGDLYQSNQEEGISLPITFVEDFNQEHQTTYKPEALIGQAITVNLLPYRKDGQQRPITLKTVITRIVKDDFADSVSYMSPKQLEQATASDDLVRLTPYVILELKNPDDTKAFVDKFKTLKTYRVMSQQDILGMVTTFIRVIQGLLIVLSFQAIVVSMVMIGIIISINIMQRSREIGVMKAVGYRNKDIRQIFTMESVVITSLSFVLAFLAAQTIGSIANVIVSEKFEAIERVFSLDMTSIGSVLALALLIGYVSAYLPTRKISQLDPVESLRYE